MFIDAFKRGLMPIAENDGHSSLIVSISAKLLYVN